MNTVPSRLQSPNDERVTAAVAATAATLNARLADVVDDMRALLATRITELDGDPALVELLRASIEGNVDTILHSLQHGIEVTRFEPPTAANEYARPLAQRGVAVNALVRAYRLGHQFLMQQTLLVINELDDEELRGPTYARVNDAVFTYIDWISQRVVSVHEESVSRGWPTSATSVRQLYGVCWPGSLRTSTRGNAHSTTACVAAMLPLSPGLTPRITRISCRARRGHSRRSRRPWARPGRR